MNNDEYVRHDAMGLSELVRAGDVSPVELIDAALRRIGAQEPRIAALVGLHEDDARAVAGGTLPKSLVTGVPFLVKDLGADVRGWPSTAANAMRRDVARPHDSTLTTRWRRAGLVPLGRTATPEFGILGTTESALYGATRNPWNTDHSVGGSSGGAAAAVAAGYVPVAHATDGGGSIRIPASACGLFGFKPSRGRVPLGPDRFEGWSGLVVAHVVSRSVRDSAAILDLTWASEPGGPPGPAAPERPYLDELDYEPNRLRVAVYYGSMLGHELHPTCRAAVEDAAKLLASLGHEVVEVAPPIERDRYALAYLTAVATGTSMELEAAAAALGRVPYAEDAEPSTWFLHQVASYLSASDLERARQTFAHAARRMAAFHDSYDVLLCATLTQPPARIGAWEVTGYQKLALSVARLAPGRRLVMRILEELAATAFERAANTQLFNLTGQPAMSVPLWTSPEGLPIGVQLAGRHGEEATLFRVARQLEEARPWADRRPPLVGALLKATPIGV